MRFGPTHPQVVERPCHLLSRRWRDSESTRLAILRGRYMIDQAPTRDAVIVRTPLVHASRPSRTARPATTNPATGSIYGCFVRTAERGDDFSVSRVWIVQ